MEIEKLKKLFKQWTECTIREKDIPELMLLLQEADVKKQLDELMEDAYKRLKEKPFFTNARKRKIFLNITNRQQSQWFFKF